MQQDWHQQHKPQLITGKLLPIKGDFGVYMTLAQFIAVICTLKLPNEAFNQWWFITGDDIISILHVELHNRISATALCYWGISVQYRLLYHPYASAQHSSPVLKHLTVCYVVDLHLFSVSLQCFLVFLKIKVYSAMYGSHMNSISAYLDPLWGERWYINNINE